MAIGDVSERLGTLREHRPLVVREHHVAQRELKRNGEERAVALAEPLLVRLRFRLLRGLTQLTFPIARSKETAAKALFEHGVVGHHRRRVRSRATIGALEKRPRGVPFTLGNVGAVVGAGNPLRAK